MTPPRLRHNQPPAKAGGISPFTLYSSPSHPSLFTISVSRRFKMSEMNLKAAATTSLAQIKVFCDNFIHFL